jgi:hypothetical protein
MLTQILFIMVGVVTWQTTSATQSPSQSIGTLIKPQYCQPVSVARREMLPLPTARIGIMDDRREALAEAALGWEKTGVPLVGFDGQRFLPAACSDDIGIFYIIPMLARTLRIPLGNAIDLFLAGIVLVSGLSGAVGLMLVCRTPFGKIIAMSALVLLSLLALKIGDVYSIQSSAVLAFVPWVLFISRKTNCHWSIFPFVLFASAAVASANLMRGHAGTPLLIFMAWIFAFQLQAKPRLKLMLVLVATLGFLLPVGYSRTLLGARDAYLQNHGYMSVAGLRQHGFWHVVYVGLGYISNDVVPGYRDEFAAARVREIAPDTIYGSPEYEQYLKHEVIHIIVQHPVLVIESLAAKLGVIVGLVLVCANVGLVGAFRYPKPWPIEVGFWNAIVFQCLIGIVAIPARPYLLGLIAFAVLYGVISIDVAVQHGVTKDVLRLIRSHRARPEGSDLPGEGVVLMKFPS